MRIVFMGTPEFAVPSLKRLVEDGHEICGVFTQPDKRRSRMKVSFSPVKEYALSQNLSVWQPERVRDEASLETLRRLRPELIVVAAYGQILSEEVLAVPALGCVNVHASLLPRYRGAAPINWAILNGDKETGVTIMYMAKRLDVGDIITAARTQIGDGENAASLYERLAALGASLLGDTLESLRLGTARRTPQNESLATYAPMLSRELSPIDWNKDAQTIRRQVLGLVPWPCAATVLCGKSAKILTVLPNGRTADTPGTLRAAKGGIEAACGDGESLLITLLQPEGGKQMSAAAWLNGKRISPGELLT